MRPRGGRPRSTEADAAIVDATLELIVEEGINALSVEEVAARAGVGKATIYRRWPSKEALVADVLGTLNDDLPDVPGAGTARDRLVDLVEQIRCRSAENPGRVIPRMVAYRDSHPELFTTFYERVIDPRRERFRQVILDGVAAGELRAGLDVELATTVLAAPMIYLNMMRMGSRGPTAEDSAAIVDYVLRGLAAPGC